MALRLTDKAVAGRRSSQKSYALGTAARPVSVSKSRRTASGFGGFNRSSQDTTCRPEECSASTQR